MDNGFLLEETQTGHTGLEVFPARTSPVVHLLGLAGRTWDLQKTHKFLALHDSGGTS